MNFFKHHIGDYDADTSHLTWTEDMAYTRLMRLYYRREAPIPEDIGQACRLVRATSKPEREAVESILNEFFTLESDGWHNRRCDAEIQEANEKAAKNRESGKLGGRPRKQKTDSPENGNRDESQSESERKPNGNPDESERKPNGFQNESENNPSQTPDSRVNPPIPPKGGNPAIEFKTFVAKCKESGEKLISDYRPVFDYAEKVQLPIAMVQLCWDEFQRRYSPGGPSESKRYKDWRKVFRNCVEGNWLKLWWLNPATDAFELTTAGRTAGRNAA